MLARLALLVGCTCFALSGCSTANTTPTGTGTGTGTGAGGTGTGGTGGGNSNYSGNVNLGYQIPANQGFLSRGGHFVVAVQWHKPPSTALYNSCVLTFADKNRRTLTSFSLQSFIPWNYQAGAGSSTAQIPLSPNTQNIAIVTASNFLLPFTGQWVLQVTATANGVSDIADVPFSVLN